MPDPYWTQVAQDIQKRDSQKVADAKKAEISVLNVEQLGVQRNKDKYLARRRGTRWLCSKCKKYRKKEDYSIPLSGRVPSICRRCKKGGKRGRRSTNKGAPAR